MFIPTISNWSVDLCYQIIGLKSLSIYLFLLAQLSLGLEMDRLPVQASSEALCSERESERERKRDALLEPTSWELWGRGAGCLSGEATYFTGNVG